MELPACFLPNRGLPALLFLLWIVAGGAGCGPEADPPEVPVDVPVPALPEISAVPDAAKLESESWHAIYIQKHHVGYGHYRRYSWTTKIGLRTKWLSEMVLAIKQGEKSISQRLELASEDNDQGEMQTCDMKMAVGASPLLLHVDRKGDMLEVVSSSAGRTARSSMEWPAAAGGIFAPEQSMLAKPLQPGEVRKVSILFPGHGTLEKGEATLRAQQYEMTYLLEGQKELLRIEFDTSTAGQTVRQLLWADRQGEVLKASHQALEQTVYRTSKERAMASEGQAPTFDITAASTVRVTFPAGNPHSTTRALYKVRLREGDPAKVFPQGASQQVRRLDDHAAEITVIAIRPTEPEKVDSHGDRTPTDNDLAPNQLLQTDEPNVIQLAMQAGANETDPWKLAVALEELVRSRMRRTPNSQAFASAAEVARTFQGDCTEHGVLLAALLRARKIPARVAIGLVYHGPSGGFAFHLWTEAWIKDRWVPLDATLARGGIGAAHLKITDSDLAGANATSAFLPVLQVMGQMEAEVIEVK